MSVQVSVQKIKDIWSPYRMKLWCRTTVHMTDVRREIKLGRFIKKPWSMRRGWTSEQHAQRIAWLVVNGWADPIEVDVGIPGIMGGFMLPDLITDGNHRLAAAIYRRDKTILANVSGSASYARELLGVDI